MNFSKNKNLLIILLVILIAIVVYLVFFRLSLNRGYPISKLGLEQGDKLVGIVVNKDSISGLENKSFYSVNGKVFNYEEYNNNGVLLPYYVLSSPYEILDDSIFFYFRDDFYEQDFSKDIIFEKILFIDKDSNKINEFVPDYGLRVDIDRKNKSVKINREDKDFIKNNLETISALPGLLVFSEIIDLGIIKKNSEVKILGFVIDDGGDSNMRDFINYNFVNNVGRESMSGGSLNFKSLGDDELSIYMFNDNAFILAKENEKIVFSMSRDFDKNIKGSFKLKKVLYSVDDDNVLEKEIDAIVLVNYNL